MAEIVANPGPLMWVPVDSSGATTVYVGSIVTDGADGVKALGTAAGDFDTTGKDGTASTAGIPLGVVVGTNNAATLYSSTYKRNYVTSIITTNANYALERQGVEGPWGKGDKQAYVQIALITPLTVVRMPIYNAALGTAPTVATVASLATGGATGVGCTTSAIEAAPVANQNGIYFRTGKNAGIYRLVQTTSTTVHTFTSPFPYAIAVGDTCVRTPKFFGTSFLQFDATSSWVNNGVAWGTDYFHTLVHKLDMSVAGQCFVDISFGAFAFMPKLA